MIVKNAFALIDKKIDVFHYEPAKETAICGNAEMEYHIPLRSERQSIDMPVKEQENETPSAKNIFDATAFGEAQKEEQLEFFINGSHINISDLAVSELVEMYAVDFDDLEAYLQNSK